LSVCPVLSVWPALSEMLAYCGQTVRRIKINLQTQADIGPGHNVLQGTHPPFPKGLSSQFSTHMCCGQMTGWIKMSLSREVGLGPGHTVLDGEPAPPKKKTGEQPNNDRPMYVVYKPFTSSSSIRSTGFISYILACFSLI